MSMGTEEYRQYLFKLHFQNTEYDPNNRLNNKKEDVKMDTLEILKQEYIEACNVSTKPNFEKPEIGTIFDEEKSVRWNREEVERKRNLYDNQIRFLKRRKSDRIEDIEKRICKYIAIITKVDMNKSKTIFNFVWNKYHSNIIEMFEYLEDQIQLIRNLFD